MCFTRLIPVDRSYSFRLIRSATRELRFYWASAARSLFDTRKLICASSFVLTSFCRIDCLPRYGRNRHGMYTGPSLRSEDLYSLLIRFLADLDSSLRARAILDIDAWRLSLTNFFCDCIWMTDSSYSV